MQLVTRRLGIDLRGNGQVARALQHALTQDSARGSSGLRLAAVWDSQGPVWQDIDADEQQVLVDCTPPRYDGTAAQAWIDRLDRTLASGTAVVTCNKAPLVLAWDRLHRHEAPLLHSATVGGGTPILPTLGRLVSCGVQRVEGVLNGTLSSVLRAVWAGQSLAEAVAAAQEAGLAEPDPRIDLDGTDALAKAIIIQHTVFGSGSRLDRLPRLRVDEEEVRQHAAPPNLVVTVDRSGITWRLEPAPWAGGEAAASAVRVTTDQGVYQISGPGAGPAATAASILADLRSLA